MKSGALVAGMVGSWTYEPYSTLHAIVWAIHSLLQSLEGEDRWSLSLFITPIHEAIEDLHGIPKRSTSPGSTGSRRWTRPRSGQMGYASVHRNRPSMRRPLPDVPVTWSPEPLLARDSSSGLLIWFGSSLLRIWE